MRIWVTTDRHIGHENIKRYCNRPQDCDDRILAGLQLLKKGDLLIHLGDVAFNNTGEIRYINAIPAGVKKWLVIGNHDKSLTFHLNQGWDWAGHSMRLVRHGKVIQFSHKPIPAYNCDIQIHGHFHNNPSKYWEGELKQVISYKHYLLILEDVDYKPVSLISILNEHF